MSSNLILERLILGGIGGCISILICLGLCRIPHLHPSVKTWLCRLVLIKLVISLIWMAPIVQMPSKTTGLATPLLTTFLLSVWLIGALIVTVFAVRSYVAAYKLSRRAELDAPFQVGSKRIAVKTLPALPEPCIAGVFRPTLLIPAKSRMDGAVIEHELAHIRHWDPQFGLAFWILQSIFWFVPGLGQLISEHSLWQEVWADLESRRALNLEPAGQAKALLDSVARVRPTYAATLGFAGDASLVARRLQAMFEGRYSVAVATIAVGLILGTTIPIGGVVASEGPVLARRVEVFSPIARRQ